MYKKVLNQLLNFKYMIITCLPTLPTILYRPKQNNSRSTLSKLSRCLVAEKLLSTLFNSLAYLSARRQHSLAGVHLSHVQSDQLPLLQHCRQSPRSRNRKAFPICCRCRTTSRQLSGRCSPGPRPLLRKSRTTRTLETR